MPRPTPPLLPTSSVNSELVQEDASHTNVLVPLYADRYTEMRVVSPATGVAAGIQGSARARSSKRRYSSNLPSQLRPRTRRYERAGSWLT